MFNELKKYNIIFQITFILYIFRLKKLQYIIKHKIQAKTLSQTYKINIFVSVVNFFAYLINFILHIQHFFMHILQFFVHICMHILPFLAPITSEPYLLLIYNILL